MHRGRFAPAQPDFQRYGNPLASAPADPEIVKALGSIDSSRIEQTIHTLVGFITRNTLSSMETSLAPGERVSMLLPIWIAAQFEQISQGCGG